MKTLAIIGASYLQRPLVEKAKHMGLRTICFAWADGAVCKDICDTFYPISILEKEEILQICQKERINGICTIASDVAAPTVAYVAQQMKLIGNSYDSAMKAYNKHKMKEAFLAAGIDCPRSIYISNLNVDVIQDISHKFTLPIIVKPTDRSGSLGITKIDDWKDFPSALHNAIDSSFKKEALVEEFIDGREISVEFISYQGKHYPLQITDKVTTGAPHFVELEHHQPSSLSKDMYERIYSITNEALNSLCITNGASHSEYKITGNGRIVVLEIGGRMGGDFIGSDLVMLSTGYDFIKGVIDVALGVFNQPSTDGFTSHKNSGVFFLSKENESLKETMDNIILHPECHPEVRQIEITDNNIHYVTSSADRSGYFIYQSDKRLNYDRL